MLLVIFSRAYKTLSNLFFFIRILKFNKAKILILSNIEIFSNIAIILSTFMFIYVYIYIVEIWTKQEMFCLVYIDNIDLLNEWIY